MNLSLLLSDSYYHINSPTLFNKNSIDLSVLRTRAYNLRWAEVPEDVIPLTAADPDFPAAPAITEAIQRYCFTGYFSYADPRGYLPFRQSLQQYYQERRGVSFPIEQILPVDTAAFGILLTCQSFLKPGDEAIIFDPVDFLFRYSIERTGAKAVSFPIPPGTAKVDFGAMEQLISAKTKMICLCNPLNPTGKVFTKEELTQLGELAIKHDLLILSDEIWSDIVFAPHVFTSMASLDETIKERTITITGFSKSYGLAGLRIGAILTTNPRHYEAIYQHSQHSATVHGANILGQVAASTAINECQGWLTDFVRHLQQMRDLTVAGLNSVNGFRCIPPEGCYVAFANIQDTGLDSAAVHALILDKAKVAVVPGLPKWFGEGAEGYIRLSFATSEEILQEAILKIKNVFEK